MLKVIDLHVHYGGITALRGINLTIKENQIVTLIGANGAGKSSTLRAIMGLVKKSQGQVLYKGEDISSRPTKDIVSKGITMVPEGRRVFANLTVEENLLLGAYTRTDQKEIARDMEAVYNTFPRLRERSWQKAGTLSGGEQQMLAIGRALMTNPRLLILDEATEGLAPTVRAVIWRCLHQLRELGQSLLIVDHHLESLLRICDRHYIIDKGHIVWSGDSAAFRADSERTLGYLTV